MTWLLIRFVTEMEWNTEHETGRSKFLLFPKKKRNSSTKEVSPVFFKIQSCVFWPICRILTWCDLTGYIKHSTYRDKINAPLGTLKCLSSGQFRQITRWIFLQYSCNPDNTQRHKVLVGFSKIFPFKVVINSGESKLNKIPARTVWHQTIALSNLYNP